MIVSKIYMLEGNNDKQTYIGDVFFNGRVLDVRPVKEEWRNILLGTAHDTIRVHLPNSPEVIFIDPATNPDEFVRSLWMAYDNPYFTASRAVIS